MLPTREHAFVRGYPPEEGNAAQVVVALCRRYPGDVYWVQAPDDAYLTRLGIEGSTKVRRTAGPWTLATLWAYLTAEIVFTTHDAYGMPTPPARKPVVNLWHGEVAKGGGALFPFRRATGPPSSYLCVASRRLAAAKLSRAGMGVDRMIWVASPRTDMLGAPASDEDLLALGVGVDRPFVLWMPTWRQATGADPSWVNTTDVLGDAGLAGDFGSQIAAILREAGITVVVKPHPLDRVDRRGPGTLTIDDTTLRDARVPLYRLLGRAGGLVSDYSSVWIDYLRVDRPIAFYSPDRTAYERGRGGLVPEAYEVLPGPELRTPADVEGFARAVVGLADPHRGDRAAARAHLGLWEESESAADALLTELAERGALRLR